jgi:hypothetical protein
MFDYETRKYFIPRYAYEPLDCGFDSTWIFYVCSRFFSVIFCRRRFLAKVSLLANESHQLSIRYKISEVNSELE